MRRDLFLIKSEFLGVPLFGIGWLLGLWAIVSAIVLVQSVRRHGWGAETLSNLPILALVAAVIVWFMPMVATPEGLPIRGYGVMLFLAVISSVVFAAYRAGRMGVDPDIVYSLSFWMVLSGIVGARAFFVVQYWDEFQDETLRATLAHLVNFSRGGLVVYGGVIAGGIVTYVYLRHYKLPALALCDLLAPSVALGLGLGRIGCFLNGCCYGGTTDVAWAVRFPEKSPPFVRQLATGELAIDGVVMASEGEPVVAEVLADSPAAAAGVEPGQRINRVGGYKVQNAAEARGALADAFIESLSVGAPLSISVAGRETPIRWRVVSAERRSQPVHPTQLYSAANGLLLCLFLTAVYPFRRRDGEVFAWLLTIQPVGRFLLEQIRTDEAGQFGTMLTISQWISLALFVGGVAFWVYLNQRPAGSVLPITVANEQRRLAA